MKDKNKKPGANQMEQQGFEIINTGLAKARFGMAIAGQMHGEPGAPFQFAAGDPPEEFANSEEFLVKPWRLLSQAVTPYRFFDFTREGVLKNALLLFADKTIYTNHYPDVNNWKGFVKNPVWDDKNNPPGINALMVIDRTIDAKLARGVEIGALRSASVTVWFKFERSHPDLRNFYDHLGTEVDGELVRFIVTEIVNCGEVSIVWEGEDPHAKSLAAGSGQEEIELESNQPGEGEDEMKLSEQFLKKLGLESTGLTEAAMEAKILAALKKLEDEKAALTADAAIGQKLLTTTREQAVSLYKTLKGEKFAQSFVDNVLDKADLATAQAFLDEYQTGLEQAIPLSCPKCGEKLQRRSSQEMEDKGSSLEGNLDDYKL